MPNTNQFFDTIRSLTGDIHRNAVKSAAALSEPGSIGGATTHPSGTIDDQLQAASEGARSAENTADVKKITGSPDATSDTVNSGSISAAVVAPGTDAGTTGEQPGLEDAYKGTKDDGSIGGETAHPAKTEDGEKYGSWSFAKLASHLAARGDELLAAIGKGELSGPAAPVAKPATKVAAAAQAGYDAAAAAKAASTGAEALTPADQQAAINAIQYATKRASHAADLTANYLAGYMQAQQKWAAAAADDGANQETHEEPAGPPTKDSGPPVGGGGSGSGAPADVESLLASAAPGGGAAPPGAEGGMPSDVGQGEIINELVQVMNEMGITIDDLAAAAAAQGAGGGAPPAGGDPAAAAGAMPPDLAGGAGAAMPPPMPKAASIDFKKLGSLITAHRRSGKYIPGPPTTKRAANIRGVMRSYLVEALKA